MVRPFVPERRGEARPGTGPVARDGEVRVLVPTPGDVDEVRPHCPGRASTSVTSPTPRRWAGSSTGLPERSVVHAAGVIHPTTVADFERINIGGTAAVVDAARRSGVRRLVHVSSNSPFGFNATPTDVFRHDEPYDPWLGYGRSKMLGERLVLDAHAAGDLERSWSGRPGSTVRSNRSARRLFFQLVRRGRFPMVGSGEQRRSMVYVDNLVQGVALAERVPAAAGEAFWVADERPYPLTEILATVKQALAEEGLEVSRRQVRLPALAGRVAQRIDTRLQASGRYHQQFHVLGEMGESIACDISRTREVLGYRPEVELLEGMRRSVRWCLAQGYTI